MPCVRSGCCVRSGGNTLNDIETGASQRFDVKTLADILDYHRESTPAGKLYQWVLAREVRSLGKDHPDTLSTVNCMANVFMDQGKYDEALEWCRRALAGEERSLGKDHPNTLATVYSMAGVFKRQGKYDEALEWYRRALAGEERSLGKDHPDTLSTVSSMANLFISLGKYDEALDWNRRALAG